MNSNKIGINISLETIVCGVFKNESIEVVKDIGIQDPLPAYVYYSPMTADIVVGHAAKQNLLYNGYCVYDILDLVGVNYYNTELQENMKQWEFKVINEGGKPKVEMLHNNRIIHLSGIEILSEILKYIKKQADESCGNDVNLKTECVISIPSYLTDFQRICIIDACERVNLKVLETASSSICANIGYNYYTKSSKDNRINLVFILDSGGLIIDIIKCDSINNKEKNLLYSKYVKGLSMNKIIDNVFNYYVDKYYNETGDLLNKKRLIRLKNGCEKAISTLCVEGYDKTILDVDFLEDEGIKTELPLNLFDKLNRNVFERIIDITKASINDIGLKPSNINSIVLVGCGSRIKRIREMLKNIFKYSNIRYDYNPEEICSIGATASTNPNALFHVDDFISIKETYPGFIHPLDEFTVIFESTRDDEEERKDINDIKKRERDLKKKEEEIKKREQKIEKREKEMNKREENIKKKEEDIKRKTKEMPVSSISCITI